VLFLDYYYTRWAPYFVILLLCFVNYSVKPFKIRHPRQLIHFLCRSFYKKLPLALLITYLMTMVLQVYASALLSLNRLKNYMLVLRTLETCPSNNLSPDRMNLFGRVKRFPLQLLPLVFRYVKLLLKLFLLNTHTIWTHKQMPYKQFIVFQQPVPKPFFLK